MAWLLISFVLALVTVLAVCRLTRLVVEDTLTQPLRDRIAARAYPPGRTPGRPPGRTAGRAWRWGYKLVTCPWCSGFWVSAAATLAYWRCWLDTWPTTLPGAFGYVVAAFACSWLSAVLADWLDSPPPPTQLVHTGTVRLDPAPAPQPPTTG